MHRELIALLTETTLASSAALLVVLLLRRPMRAVFGAGAAYTLWWLVPVALIAVILPAPVHPLALMQRVAMVGPLQGVPLASAESTVPWLMLLLLVWAAGALTLAALQLWQQQRFLRRLGPLRVCLHGLHVATSSAGLPAVTGLIRPRIVLPADFMARYDRQERALVVAHERQHIARGDLPCNALVALLRCVYWFNPLLHGSVARYRQDQELACDAHVLARYPRARRSYAQAMLKTQLDDFALPVGCHWHTHPIKERIAMLKRPSPRRWQTRVSSALLLALLAAGGYTAWAQQPASMNLKSTDAADRDPSRRYEVLIQLVLDGKTYSFTERPSLGETFHIEQQSMAGRDWQGDFSLHDGVVGGLVLDSHVTRDGALVLSGGSSVTPPIESMIELDGFGSKDVLYAKVVGWSDLQSLGMKQAGKMEGDEVDLAGSAKLKVPDAGSLVSDSGSTGAMLPPVSSRPPPRYPVEAARGGISGSVVVIADVAADGQVTNATIDKSEPAGVFDETSLDTVKKWKFKPATENGKAVAGRVRVPIDFEVDPPAAQKQEGGAKQSNVVSSTPDRGVRMKDVGCDQIKGSNANQLACEAKVPVKVGQSDQASISAAGKQVLADVAADGTVSNVRLNTGRKPDELKRAMIKAITSTRLEPAIKDGQAVSGTVAFEVRALPGFMAGR